MGRLAVTLGDEAIATSDTVAVVESTYLITPSGHNYDK